MSIDEELVEVIGLGGLLSDRCIRHGCSEPATQGFLIRYGDGTEIMGQACSPCYGELMAQAVPPPAELSS